MSPPNGRLVRSKGSSDFFRGVRRASAKQKDWVNHENHSKCPLEKLTRRCDADLYLSGFWAPWPTVWPPAPPAYAAFPSESERRSAAALRLPPLMAAARCCSPGSCWWRLEGRACRRLGRLLHGIAGEGNETYFSFSKISNNYHIKKFTSKFAHLVRHECGDGASNLVVVHAGGGRTQQDEEESDRDGDLENGLQLHRLLQPHKRHGGLLQEVHTAWREEGHDG